LDLKECWIQVMCLTKVSFLSNVTPRYLYAGRALNDLSLMLTPGQLLRRLVNVTLAHLPAFTGKVQFMAHW